MAEAVLLADRSTLVVEVEEGRVEVSGGEGEEVEQGLGGELKVTLLLGRLWGDWSEPPSWCLISGLLLASGGGASSAGSCLSRGARSLPGGLGPALLWPGAGGGASFGLLEDSFLLQSSPGRMSLSAFCLPSTSHILNFLKSTFVICLSL